MLGVHTFYVFRGIFHFALQHLISVFAGKMGWVCQEYVLLPVLC